MNPIKNLLTIIISPKKGWDKISREDISAEKLSSSLLYPILGVFAAIVFLLEIKFTGQRSESGIEKAIQYASIAFIQFFSTYFLISFIVKKLFKKYDIQKCNIYLLYIISTTTIFYTIMTFFSSYINYIAPLSLFIIYYAWTGYKYIDIGADKTDAVFVVTTSTMVLMFPIIISLILRTLLTLI